MSPVRIVGVVNFLALVAYCGMMLLSPGRANADISRLWGNPACPKDDPYKSVAQQHHLDDLIDAAGPFEISGKRREADSKWRAAYNFARSICFEIPAADGDRLLEKRLIPDAFARYVKDVRLVPAYSDYDAADPWMNGMQAGSHGDLAAAQRWFRKAIRLAPVDRTNGFPEAHFMLGVTLYAQGRQVQAVDEWRATLARSGPAQPDWVEAGAVWPSALRFYGIAKGWNRM